MNKLITTVLFAGLLAAAIGILSLSGVSGSSLMYTAAPQTQQAVFGMLGHVEYTLMNADGSVKAYHQGDNEVVQTGKDCIARMAFNNDTDPGKCATGNNEFTFIAIGNHTVAGVPDASLTALETQSAGNCAASGVSGEMARKLVVATFTTAGFGAVADGTIVKLETADPFDFDAGNATGPIMQSGLFERGEINIAADGSCSAGLALGTSNMFSVQDLNVDNGITVSSGDSLSIKWTITVG